MRDIRWRPAGRGAQLGRGVPLEIDAAKLLSSCICARYGWAGTEPADTDPSITEPRARLGGSPPLLPTPLAELQEIPPSTGSREPPCILACCRRQVGGISM
jgi:hypothetical protein